MIVEVPREVQYKTYTFCYGCSQRRHKTRKQNLHSIEISFTHRAMCYVDSLKMVYNTYCINSKKDNNICDKDDRGGWYFSRHFDII